MYDKEIMMKDQLKASRKRVQASIQALRRKVRLAIGGLSIKNKLMLSYAVMMLAPILILGSLVFMAQEGIEKLNPVHQRNWVQLLPSQINGILVNQSASVIYKKLHQHDVDLDDFRFYTAILEWEGLDVLVAKDGDVIYRTPSLEASHLALEYDEGHLPLIPESGQGPSQFQSTRTATAVAPTINNDHKFDHKKKNKLQWNDDQLNYTIIVPETGWEFYGRGNMLFLGKSVKQETMVKIAMEMTVGAVILLFFSIVWYMGVLMARSISRMIVEPVTDLRDAARAVKNGNWSTPIHAVYNDEIGDMCDSFDAMRQTLQEQAAAKKAYEEQRRLMLSGIGHDLATPLTAINGFAEGLKMGVAKTPEQEQHYIDRIIERASVMKGLVDNLREFSKLDGGGLPLHMSPVNLPQSLCAYVENYGPSYAERGLELRMQDCQQELWVNLDAYQWNRVITNILENALKYGHGPDDSHVLVDMSCRVANGKVTLTLADHGPGVDDQDLDKLFDVFYRTDQSRTNVASGSGLGLAIVKQIVVSMKGSVVAQNRPGGGLAILITLPVLESKNPEDLV